MLLGIILFILGLCVGSFLNAFLYRYETKQKLTGRSFCPKCRHKIAWYDNIPLASYIILHGKCRHCKKPISLQYPAVELATGILFFAFAVKFENLPHLNNCLVGLSDVRCQLSAVVIGQLSVICLLLIVSTLVLITIYDLKTKEIPNGFNLVFIVSAGIYLFLSQFSSSGFLLTVNCYLLSGLAAFLFLYFFVAVSHETWMGGGDAKFAFGMGILLGPWNTLLAILIASWTGAIFGITKLIIQNTKHKKMSSLRKQGSKEIPDQVRNDRKSHLSAVNGQLSKGHEIPFGPFLVLGTIISLLFGSQIIAWYARIFLGL